jgi:DNA-3-methyladenine glycosylase
MGIPPCSAAHVKAAPYAELMMQPRPRLPRAFFDRPTLEVARDLIGKRLVRLMDSGERLSGLILECEAYIGSDDLGCHARAGMTKRNASMWGPAGHAYVYFTYGMHWMLNVVTEREGYPAAVLLRALHPQEGLDSMRGRRPGRSLRQLTDGPAKLCQAMAIDRRLDGEDLCHPEARLFLEQGVEILLSDIVGKPRVGLRSTPEPWKSIPWAFHLKPHLSAALLAAR